MPALGSKAGSRRGSPGKRCSYPGGGNGSCWAVNIQPDRRLGDARQGGGCTSLGGWAKLSIHGCGGSATRGGDYLAIPPTFASCSSKTAHSISCSSAAACTYSSIALDTYGCSCSHISSLGNSCGYLAAPSPNFNCSYPAIPSCLCSNLAAHSCPCGHLTSMPIWVCGLLGWAKPLAFMGGQTGQWI